MLVGVPIRTFPGHCVLNVIVRDAISIIAKDKKGISRITIRQIHETHIL